MKQYLSPEQTAKLIELGFEKPKSAIGYSYPEQSDKQQAYEASLGLAPYLATVDQIEFEYAYSIGELIEIIDSKVTLEIDKLGARWMVSVLIFDFTGTELIDCLFDACVKLKEEGVYENLF